MNSNVLSMIANAMNKHSIILMDVIYRQTIYIPKKMYVLREEDDNYTYNNSLIDYIVSIYGNTLPRWMSFNVEDICISYIRNLDAIKGHIYAMKIYNKENYDLTQFTNLKKLDCSDNNLSTLHKWLCNLTHLNCSMNNIQCIPETFINLKYLYCSCNPIKNISHTFIQLIYLDIHRTQVSKLPDSLVNLKYLVCGKYVTHIPDTYVKLIELDISYNTYITYIPDTIIQLERCCMCFVRKITNIPKTLTQLKWLNLSATAISNIPDTLVNLECICCIDTQIDNIPKTLIKLQKIYCDNTPKLDKQQLKWIKYIKY